MLLLLLLLLLLLSPARTQALDRLHRLDMARLLRLLLHLLENHLLHRQLFHRLLVRLEFLALALHQTAVATLALGGGLEGGSDDGEGGGGGGGGLEIGAKFTKYFDGHGDFEGTIVALPAGDGELYMCHYDGDDDEEELSAEELQTLMGRSKITYAQVMGGGGLKAMSVVLMRQTLESFGMSSGGRKAELQQRLVSACKLTAGSSRCCR